MTWTAHGSGWILTVHITGRNNAELAPQHVREILTAPTTEFKAISPVGVVAALVLAVFLHRQGPRLRGWFTVVLSVVCALVYLAGFGLG